MIRCALLSLLILCPFALASRITFLNCQSHGWTCVNNAPDEIIYVCPLASETDHTIHLKDFFNEVTVKVTIGGCKHLKVVLDCPQLRVPSHLQHFHLKDLDKLEFVSSLRGSSVQTPPEFTIENVMEIVSIPKGTFKSPINYSERKCLGSSNTLKIILIKDSKINTIEEGAIHNVTGIQLIKFQNVTVSNIKQRAIEAVMAVNNSLFCIENSRISNIDPNAIKVYSKTMALVTNVIGNIHSGGINTTSDTIDLVNNSIGEINIHGLVFKAADINIVSNEFKMLKSGALNNVKCSRKRTAGRKFNMVGNKMEHIGPSSLCFDFNSCKEAGVPVSVMNNRIDCRCQSQVGLNSAAFRQWNCQRELTDVILSVSNNNTCLNASCHLPVEVLRVLQKSNMCHPNLAPDIMCLVYKDNHTNNKTTRGDDAVVTEMAPAFYIVRQASSKRDSSSALTVLDRDALLSDGHLNMTNRTTIPMVFDSSKDFVETLRGSSSSQKRNGANSFSTEPIRVQEYPARTCSGTQCPDPTTYNKQKALDFYKYVYAQLRPKNSEKEVNHI